MFLFGNHSDRQLERSISDQYIGPLEVSLVDPIKAVACGNQHTVVLTEKGEVYTYGIWSSFIFILNLRVRKWKFLN